MFYNNPKHKHNFCAIYRGSGGAGDAVTDSSSEARAAVEARDAAIAAKVAAEAARDAALIAETNAETAENNAETAETNAETAATAAQLAETNAETAQAAAEAARDASINMAENFDVDVNTLSAGSSATVNYDNNAFLLTLGIPRGDTGATGATGPANSLSIGTVTTGAAGSSASATITGTAPNQTLSLTIPRGDKGDTGNAGAAATIAVGTVTTGSAGSSVIINNVGTSSAAIFDFTIPRGDTGATGATGPQGPAGTNGVDGDDGRGIVSIVRTSGTGAAGTTDTYTITYTDATTSTFQVYNGANGTGSGTVSSVALTVPTGLTVTGSPITTSGTLAISLASGYSIPTTSSQSNWDTAYGWGNHASAGYLDTADIGTTVQAYDSNLTSFVGAFTLPTTDGTSGQVLSTNGSGTLSFSTPPAGYSNSDVDAHLNTSTATTDQVLSWNGSDYDWVDQSSGGSTTLTIDNKTAAYTVVAGDLGKVLRYNGGAGNVTFSLTSAATLGAGFWCWIWNYSGDNTVTIDPAGSETIDGVSTLVLRRGGGTMIVSDGTNWITGDQKTLRGYAENIYLDYPRPQAVGTGSIAIGRDSQANNSMSAAIGNNSGFSGSVASANGAMALGGSYASGTDSFAAGIGNNTSSYGARNTSAIAIGYQAQATAAYSFALDYQSQATAIGSRAIGYQALASGTNSMALGRNANATESYSYALGWSKSDKSGKFTYGSGEFSAVGDAQQGTFVLRRQTTTATPAVLTTDGGSGGVVNQVTLPNDSTFAFKILVVARRTDVNDESAGYEFSGVIDRNANAASTALVGTVTKTVLAEDTTAWDVNVTADTTNGGLKVEVTGEAGKTIRWVATVWTSEVTG